MVVGYFTEHCKAYKKDLSYYINTALDTSYLLTGAASFAPVTLPKQTKYAPYDEATAEVLSMAFGQKQLKAKMSMQD